MVRQQRVLIVDRSQETREVLRTALERRGFRILAASRLSRGVELAREHQPDLIVLDLEVERGAPEAVCAPLAEHARQQETPIVILGGVCRKGSCPESGKAGQFIAKPYHYGSLIRTIEELLNAQQKAYARSA